jgi:hypothetical protein
LRVAGCGLGVGSWEFGERYNPQLATFTSASI